VHSSRVKFKNEEREGFVWDPLAGSVIETSDQQHIWEPMLETIIEETTEELNVLRQRCSSTSSENYDFDIKEVAENESNSEDCST
jgi:hypothetical protein